MHITDCEHFCRDRVCGSRLACSRRSDSKAQAKEREKTREDAWNRPVAYGPLTVNSSTRTVSEVHGPYELYGPSKRYLPLITSLPRSRF